MNLDRIKELYEKSCTLPHSFERTHVLLELMDSIPVMIKALEKAGAENTILKAFYQAWCRAESNRGCYSCSEPHDCRCPKARSVDGSNWKGKRECVCGRDELDRLDDELAHRAEG